MSEVSLYLRKSSTVERLEKDTDETVFIHLSRTEALRVISSLSQQILTGNPNCGRPEFWAKSNIGGGRTVYLSIAVDTKGKKVEP